MARGWGWLRTSGGLPWTMDIINSHRHKEQKCSRMVGRSQDEESLEIKPVECPETRTLCRNTRVHIALRR